MKTRTFDLIYFGLVALAVSFVLYMGVDFAYATTNYDAIFYKQGNYTISYSNGILFNDTNSSNVFQKTIDTYPQFTHFYIKDSNYTINHRVRLNVTNLVFDCESSNVFFIKNNTESNQQVMFINGGHNHDTISNCSFDGKSSTHQNDTSAILGLIGDYTTANNISIYNYHNLGMTISGKYVNINNCNIIGLADGVNSNMGIWYWSPKNIVNVDNCKISGNFEGALFGEGNGTVTRGVFVNNQVGHGGGQIAFQGNFTISDNFISNGQGLSGGIELNNGNYIIIGNQIKNNLYGIASNVGTKSNVIAMGNIIQKSSSGYPIEYSTGVNMTDIGNIKQQ